VCTPPPSRASGPPGFFHGLVWRYDGRAFEPVAEREQGGERGEVGRLADVPAPLEAACRVLRSRPGVEAIHALAFPVKPAPGPADRAAPAPGASSPAGAIRPERIIGAAARAVLPAAPVWAPSPVAGFVRGFRGQVAGPTCSPRRPALPERRGTELVPGSFGDAAAAVRAPPDPV
jgi:hypothetical protein